MARELWASLGLALVLAGCSLPSLDGATDGDGESGRAVPVATSPGSATVVEDALLVGGDDSIVVHPAEGDPFPIVTGEPVAATFEDGAGGLLYVTDAGGDRRAVRHIPAGSGEAYTLVDDLTHVYDMGIVRGLPAVLGSRRPSDGAPTTLVAVHLTGEEQPLVEIPATAERVDQGGARIVLGHVDRSTTPVCTWIEVLELSGQVLPPPPGLSDDPTCEEGVNNLPMTALSTDGRRFAIAQPDAEGTAIRVVDLDLGDEQVILVPDARSLDLGLSGGLVVSGAGVVELSPSGQTWLRPLPPDTEPSDPIELLSSPLRIGSDVADGDAVALSDEQPPGVVFLAGEVLIGRGSAGETVLNWQRQLNRWLAVTDDLPDRTYLGLTGVYDAATETLTNDFVARAGLNDDGQIDERELDELNRRVAVLENGPGIIQDGDSGDIVARWQLQLDRWAELAEPEDLRGSVRPDGLFGDGTEDAQLVFEQAVGNREDGIVQPADRAAMEQALIDLGAGRAADADDEDDEDDD